MGLLAVHSLVLVLSGVVFGAVPNILLTIGKRRSSAVDGVIEQVSRIGSFPYFNLKYVYFTMVVFKM
jgi:hypothetical protein